MSRPSGLVHVFARVLACCVVCLTSASNARAQGAQADAVEATEHVLVTVPDCHGADSDEVVKLVALELAPRMQVLTQGSSAQGEPSAQLTGAVQCGDAIVVITVEDPKRAPALRVELDLQASVPEARARLLALALAELITTSRLERTPEPKPVREAAPEENAAEQAADESDSEQEPVLQLWLAPGLSSAGAPATVLFGGDIGVARAFGRVLLLMELQARLGRADVDSSEISVASFSALAGVAPLLLTGDVKLSVGAGARIGHVNLSAKAQGAGLAGDELSGVWLGPALIAALELPLLGPGALRLGLEAGYVARGVIGLDERGQELMGLRGVWLSAGLGFSLHLR